MARAAVIDNPMAGGGQAEALSRRAATLLCDAGWDVERFSTGGPGGAFDIARDVSKRVDRIVVVGGDGSLRETIAGLGEERRRIEVGLIPIGNANVVARELGIPLDAEAALAALLESKPVLIDVGYANSELFLAVVGIGWDAIAVRYLDRLRGTRTGGLWYRAWADSVYVFVGILAMLRARWPRFRIRADGVELERAFCSAYFCNCRTYAKGWSMAPDADCQSGELHYQARKRSPVPFLVWQLLAALLGRRTPRFISVYQSAREIVVDAERPFSVQVDGDFRSTLNHLRLEIQPRTARVLVPPTSRLFRQPA